MKKISLQDMLDTAYEAFITQQRPPAIDLNNNCVHLDEFGNRDPLGYCLLYFNHSTYHPILECRGTLDETVGLFPELFDDQILSMRLGTKSGDCPLDLFQARLHDDHIVDGRFAKTPGELRDAYMRVAKTYNLEMPK